MDSFSNLRAAISTKSPKSSRIHPGVIADGGQSNIRPTFRPLLPFTRPSYISLLRVHQLLIVWRKGEFTWPDLILGGLSSRKPRGSWQLLRHYLSLVEILLFIVINHMFLFGLLAYGLAKRYDWLCPIQFRKWALKLYSLKVIVIQGWLGEDRERIHGSVTFSGQHNWPRYELRCLLHISLDHKLLGGWPHVPFLFGYAKIVVSVALIFVVHESLYLLQTIPLNFLKA